MTTSAPLPMQMSPLRTPATGMFYHPRDKAAAGGSIFAMRISLLAFTTVSMAAASMLAGCTTRTEDQAEHARVESVDDSLRLG